MLKIVIDSNNIPIDSKEKFSLPTINYYAGNAVRRLFSRNNGDSINMEDIQREVTPIIKDIDVFFSYDHFDAQRAQKLASYFDDDDYKVFLDSMFWSSVDDLADAFIKKYGDSKDPSGLYNPKKVRQTLSTFNMILADSIIETIKNSKVFVFIRNSLSKKDSRTVSPWIYLENKMAKDLLGANRRPILENFESKPEIRFKLDTFGYYRVDSVDELVSLLKKDHFLYD